MTDFEMSPEEFESLKERLLAVVDEKSHRPWLKDPKLAEGMIVRAALEAERLSVALDKATAELANYKASYEVFHDAGKRATEMWQKATGDTRTWPDHAKLCVWLLERLADAEEMASARLDEMNKLTALVKRFWNYEDPCDYDHHDSCQAHSLHQRPCPYEQAAAMFELLTEASDE